MFPGWKDPLEKGMATHSSVLAWRVPWTAGTSRLQPMGSQRGGRDWATLTSPSPVIKQINMQKATGYSPKYKEYGSRVVTIHYLKYLIFNNKSWFMWRNNKMWPRSRNKSKIQKNKFITMFIAALFTITRTWKQPKCPSTDNG